MGSMIFKTVFKPTSLSGEGLYSFARLFYHGTLKTLLNLGILQFNAPFRVKYKPRMLNRTNKVVF